MAERRPLKAVIQVRVLVGQLYRGVEESGHPRLPWKQENAGSNPAAPTVPVAQLEERLPVQQELRVRFPSGTPRASGEMVNTLVLETSGCRFESCLAHKKEAPTPDGTGASCAGHDKE